MASLTRYPSSATGTFSTVGDTTYGSDVSVDWTGPTLVAEGSSGIAATASLSASRQTHRLDVTNWGITTSNIPSGSTILGISASVLWSVGNAGRTVSELQIRLIKGGSPSGDNKAANSSSSTTYATNTFGGAADLWGNTFTDTDIRSSGFGLAIQYSRAANPATDVRVDLVGLTIYFSRLVAADATLSAVGVTAQAKNLASSPIATLNASGIVVAGASIPGDMTILNFERATRGIMRGVSRGVV